MLSYSLLFQPQTVVFVAVDLWLGHDSMLACVWGRLALWLNSCHRTSPPDLCRNSIRTPPCRCQSHIAMVTPVREVSGEITGEWLMLVMGGGGVLESVKGIYLNSVLTQAASFIYWRVYASHLERNLLDNKQFMLRVCVSRHGLSVSKAVLSPSCLLLSLYLTHVECLVMSRNFQRTYCGKNKALGIQMYQSLHFCLLPF